jgi:hypothetical protein
MLLQSLRALCLAPGGPGSIWNYLGASVRSTGVSGRFKCGFWTDLHFADATSPQALASRNEVEPSSIGRRRKSRTYSHT